MQSHIESSTGGRRVWWMMDGWMDGWWCGCSNPPHSNQPLLKRECDGDLIDDDGRAASAGGAGSCAWPVAISFQIFCHFKKAVAMIFVCVWWWGEEWWIEWWMYEKIVVVVVLEVVNYVWGAGCVYLLLVYGSMMGMYGVWFGCVMDFWLDVLNYVWGAGCVY